MKTKKLSEFITELQDLLKETGDGFIEAYDEEFLGVPFVLYSEDDQQYYVDVAKEDE